MALSRYQSMRTVNDPKKNTPRVETFPAISAADIADQNDVIIEWKDGMRMDALAFQYLGDGRYWWAICIANDLNLPFAEELQPGTRIVIPGNISKILRFLENNRDKA